MARRRRPTNVFSLSFLDVMACGFGAVVLVYLLISHDVEDHLDTAHEQLLAEIRRLDYQVEQGQLQLAEIRDTVDATERDLDEAAEQRVSASEELDARRLLLAELNVDARARMAHLNELQSDIEARERELERLRAQAEAAEGTQARAFMGDGDRQYLTGLRTGGERILIAVDVSASMLDETLINLSRGRNMPESRRLEAPKWQRTIRTVEWLVAQLPLESQFQLYTFNTQAGPLVNGANGSMWLEVADNARLDEAVTTLKQTVPQDGSSLENLFIAIEEMNPRPDNVFLITDSLPTQGTSPPRSATIDGNGRMRLFRDAMRRLPSGVPVNVILLPLEGDHDAAAAYWDLTHTTNATFLAPSRDWP